MGVFRALPLNLNVCRITTGRHLCRGFFVNKISGGISANIFSSDSRTGTFLWIMLSFTEHLFQKAVCVIFSPVSYFSYVKSCKTMNNSDSVTLLIATSLKAPLNSTWFGETFICLREQFPVLCSAKYSSSWIVFIDFYTWIVHRWIVNRYITCLEIAEPSPTGHESII